MPPNSLSGVKPHCPSCALAPVSCSSPQILVLLYLHGAEAVSLSVNRETHMGKTRLGEDSPQGLLRRAPVFPADHASWDLWCTPITLGPCNACCWCRDPLFHNMLLMGAVLDFGLVEDEMPDVRELDMIQTVAVTARPCSWFA